MKSDDKKNRNVLRFIEITHKFVIPLIKYGNAVTANWLMFFFVYPQYSVHLDFTDSDLNKDLDESCMSNDGNYIIPYQPCSIDEMFELNEDKTAHIIMKNGDCLPGYLSGSEVMLQNYDGYKGDDDVVFKHGLTDAELGLQGFTNVFLLLFLLPVLYVLNFKEMFPIFPEVITRNKLLNKFLYSVLYTLAIDCTTYGPINSVIAEEKCDSLYTPSQYTGVSIYTSSIVLILGSVIPLLLTCLVSTRTMCYLMTCGNCCAGEQSETLSQKLLAPVSVLAGMVVAFKMPFVMAVAGLTTFIFQTAFQVANGVDVFFNFPLQMNIASNAWFSGGICKIISLILTFEYIIYTLSCCLDVDNLGENTSSFFYSPSAEVEPAQENQNQVELPTLPEGLAQEVDEVEEDVSESASISAVV